MRNEDIIKHLMNIKDGCLSSCEKAAVTGAIDIVSDYDKAAALSGRLTADYETGKQPVKMGENYFACPRCGKRTGYNHTHCHWCGQLMIGGREHGNSRRFHSRGKS